MNFPFNIDKATEAACMFLQKEGGAINIMKLVKLMYLLDRLSLERRGLPVFGGRYFSMRNGPVPSEVLDLINSGEIWGQTSAWSSFISDRRGHQVALEKEPDYEHLSPREQAFIDAIYVEHGSKTQYELRDWCHDHCREWKPLQNGRAEIELDDMGKVLGKNTEEIAALRTEALETHLLKNVLGAV